jgi:signal transduction histidine kinase
MQAEKMGALGKLAAGVAHQLNNPLTAIALFNRILTDEYDLPEAARKDLARVAEAVDRCQKTVTELLHFARQSAMNFCHNDINRAIDRTMFLLENQPLFTEIEIGRHFDPDLPPVYADVQQLGHVFMNVILNAAEAMNGQGRLDLYTRSLENGDRVQVEIADTGPGILTEVAPHIFEPFFTTKGDGRGTGLGLSVAYGVIESHQGRISVKNREPGGARFIIELPTQPPTET